MVRPRIVPGRAATFAILLLLGATFSQPALAASGDLDPAFDGDGKVLTDFPGASDDRVTQVALQADGKVIAAGSVKQDPEVWAAVGRYNTDGSLDASFGSGGTTVIGAPDWQAIYGLAVQADQKIVAAGPTVDGRFVMARLDPDGSLDETFGSGGYVRSDLTPQADHGNEIAIDTLGRIVFVGIDYPSPRNLVVARYLPDGSLDPAFAGGYVEIDVDADEGADGVLVQPDGRIVVLSTASPGSAAGRDVVLVRLLDSGALDASFGAGGIARIDIAGDADVAVDVTLLPDGKLVAAGSAVAGGVAHGLLLQLLPDGSLDPAFGSGGIVTETLGVAAPLLLAVQRASDGALVVAGGSLEGEETTKALAARFLADGTLDAGFGAGGVAIVDFASGGEFFHHGVLQPDGKLVAVGASLGSFPGSDDPFRHWALARLDAGPGAPPTTTVQIDVDPHSAKNKVNTRSHGVIQVAVLTTPTFDALSIDPATACFGSTSDPDARDCTVHGAAQSQDVDHDGDADLVLRFETHETGIQSGDTTATLTAETTTGGPAEGSDTIDAR